jgi:hypothetical protein
VRLDPTLPGAEFVIPGLADLLAGRVTGDSLLVLVAASRLREAGVAVPADPSPERGAVELRLYAALCESHGPAAYSQYNSRLRRLQSFVRAAELSGAGATATGRDPG